MPILMLDAPGLCLFAVLHHDSGCYEVIMKCRSEPTCLLCTGFDGLHQTRYMTTRVHGLRDAAMVRASLSGSGDR